MDRTELKNSLFRAIQKAVENGDKQCASLAALSESFQLASLEGLESCDWPYVMADVEDELRFGIPDDVNIFLEGRGKSKRKRTMKETLDLLDTLSSKRGPA